jgi:hypothetical protein
LAAPVIVRRGVKHTMRQHNARPHGWRAASWLTTALLATVLVVGAFAQDARAQDNGDEISFDEADLFLELNDSAGDLGIQAFIDGDAWRKLKIEAPNGRQLLLIRAMGRLARQSLTELRFESAEPSLDELSAEEFFRRFPEGEYEIQGRTLEGDVLELTADLTHVMPGPPDGILVSGTPIDLELDCDEEDPPVVMTPVVISWEPVTLSHPEIGITGEMIEVDSYQLVVDQDVEEQELIFNVDLPPDLSEYQVEVPSGFIGLGGEGFGWEILVREASGNLTAVESCFTVEE